MPDALRGIRVIEMTTAVAGPVACHVLGDMGAEVIKIEEPRTHRTTRLPPRPGAPDRPYNRLTNFNELNRSKRHIALDVARPAGREVLLRLARVSDVLVENFSPRVMGNLGLDYEELRAVNPGIVMVSMPAFGKSGPYATRGSYGPGVDAMSGLSHLTGYSDRGPGKPGNFFCDQNAGLHAAFCTLAALRHRRRTGEGQHIEMAMLEGELQSLAPALMDALLNGRSQRRTGNRHAWRAPQGVYRCAGEDEWVALSVASDEEWRALCAAMGRADLDSDGELASAEGRSARHDEIDAVIGAWTAGLTKREVEARLQASGVSAGAALNTAELFEDPELRHRGSFAWVDHPESGAFPHTRTAWRSRSGNEGVSGPAPLFGEATDYVLRELLGMAEDEVGALLDANVVSREPVEA
jgi:benzylsuccinate CoA-transferase BbsF subunit